MKDRKIVVELRPGKAGSTVEARYRASVPALTMIQSAVRKVMRSARKDGFSGPARVEIRVPDAHL